MMIDLSGVFRYWGKTRRTEEECGEDYHLLPWHSLDVAAVAAYWWDNSPALRGAFSRHQTFNEQQIKAWLLFFIALHDIGKFDIRFQCKSKDTWLALHPEDRGSILPDYEACHRYEHGAAGLHWFIEDFQPSGENFESDFLAEPEPHLYESWIPWIEAVTGHHGFILSYNQRRVTALQMPDSYKTRFVQRDKDVRLAWISVLEKLFLQVEGLSVNDSPPRILPLMAGFCSVADWLGSWNSADTFHYSSQLPANIEDVRNYFVAHQRHDAALVLERSGLLSVPCPYGGVKALLDAEYLPRQLQILVDKLPVSQGLTVIEAPTGSGKTETALAYAWKLVENQLADSIVFALPTQATTNAMLARMEKLAERLFMRPNLILAHGNSRFNHDFQAIKQRGVSAQGKEEAWAQCCEWLAQRSKRVFLGQIGVCTVDQVLISVLPVKHRFIRGFGVGRSVLIVDEIHAYDTYMYGLLDAVLKAQSESGGSTILLSATLPEKQRTQLLNSYGGHAISTEACQPAPYPLINWRGLTSTHQFDLQNKSEHLPKRFSIQLEPLFLEDMMPDETLLARMLAAARDGAQVCLICNLVDVAQNVWWRLWDKAETEVEIQLFHARYTFTDRQKKEEKVLRCFGKEGDRSRGRILVATQVVEQSLDVDFDWLIIQHCPADLLFQRLGRLHRHTHRRPAGFSLPYATIILPGATDYGLTGKIYGNVRVLWRTQQHIETLDGGPLVFPDAYRTWLDAIYAEDDDDGNEPEWVSQCMDEYENDEMIKRGKARSMLEWAKVDVLRDSDENIRAVTRDGEMNLSLVPYYPTAEGKRLLDGQIVEQLSEYQRYEALALNRVNVPASWRRSFTDDVDEDGLLWLEGTLTNGRFCWQGKTGVTLYYCKEQGMEKMNESDR